MPGNEYFPEADEIIKQIAECKSEDDVVTLVHQVFIRFFGANNAGPRSRYERAGKESWRLWQEHTGAIPKTDNQTPATWSTVGDGYRAAFSGDTGAVDNLVAEVRAKSRILFDAAEQGNAGVVQALLDEGTADINVVKATGATPLYVASQNGHVAVVRALLEKGAALNARTNDGESALYIASLKGHLPVVHALLEKGADVDAKTNAGVTALAAASDSGVISVLRAATKSPA